MLLDIFRPYLVSFISIFIAMDIVSKIWLFLSITEKFSFQQKRKLKRHSVISALILTVFFVFAGNYLMMIMGIAPSDFKIAGGILLIFLAVNSLISKRIIFLNRRKFSQIGLLPLGTPLIAPPALFIVSLISLYKIGVVVTLTMLTFNLAVAWLVLEKNQIIIKIMGDRGIRLFSKVLNILLAAFAVMAIRQGIIESLIK